MQLARISRSSSFEGQAYILLLQRRSPGQIYTLVFKSAALYPIDTIKTRLQASISGGGIRALLRGGGGNALYAGVWGNLAGVVPASAIFMGVYEPVKQHILKNVPENKNYLGALIGGAAAGFTASFVRVPTEVIKQRLQTGVLLLQVSL